MRKSIKKLMFFIVVLYSCLNGILYYTSLKNKKNTSQPKLCPNYEYNSYGLNDSFSIDERFKTLYEIETLFKSKKLINLKNGGIHLTIDNNDCISNKNIAIIVPYRKREHHLSLFLYNLHMFLSRQKLNYGIYVIEQGDDDEFNRGILINLGFLEAIKDQLNNFPFLNYNCFIFHDVDFLPANGRNIYKCSNDFPLHLATNPEQAAQFKNWLPDRYWGGVFSMTKEQFLSINGLSNLFFSWGGEDDNLYVRVKMRYGKFLKRPMDIGKYRTPLSNHTRIKHNRTDKLKLFVNDQTRKNNITEGLSTLKYEILDIQRNYLFAKIKVTFEKAHYLERYNLSKRFYFNFKKQ